MRRSLIAFALLIASALPAFGREFPVTNTRYGAAYGKSQLVSNEQDFFLFWNDREKVRATKLREGDARGGHVVLDVAEDFDVVWNGTAFVIVAFRSSEQGGTEPIVVSRLLDGDARPLAAETTIGPGRSPRIAVDRESMLLLYKTPQYESYSLLLGRDGRPTGQASKAITPPAGFFDVASNGNGFVTVTSGTDLRIRKLNGNGELLSEVTVNPTRTVRDVAIAGNGADYLVAWCAEGNVMAMAFDDDDARPGPRQTIETDADNVIFAAASLAGEASGWSLAYTRLAGRREDLRIAHVDAQAQVARREELSGAGAPSLATLQGRTLATWYASADSTSPTFVSALPLDQNEPRVATYAAARQQLLGSASSGDGALLLWQETLGTSRTIHSGVRSRNGDWHEQTLPTAAGRPLLTASDGSQFLVVARSTFATSTAQLLDEIGRPVLAEQIVPNLLPQAATWNGESYAVFGRTLQGAAIVLLSRLGTWSPPIAVDVPGIATNPSLASDGDGYLLTWEVADDCSILSAAPPCQSTALHGARFARDGRRLDAADLVFSSVAARNAGVVRSGSQYLAAWVETSPSVVGLASLASTGEVHVRRDIDGPASSSASLAATRDGAALALGDRLLVLDRTLSIVGRVPFESTNVPFSIPIALGLADGRAAYAIASLQDAAPHHGTSHVMMAIADAAPVPAPLAPRPLAKLENGKVVVAWSGAAGAVNGYRLEYRIDDGSWNELEGWFAPGDQRVVFSTARPGSIYAFRVRAFNDGGASDSEATYVNAGRRRAVGR